MLVKYTQRPPTNCITPHLINSPSWVNNHPYRYIDKKEIAFTAQRTRFTQIVQLTGRLLVETIQYINL